MYYPDEQPQQTTRNNLRLTKDGVNHVMLSKSNPVVGKVMPAFDFSLNPKDEAFSTSYMPYRDASRLSEQGLPLFTSWFYYFPMHTYLGKSKHFFVSPRVRKTFDPSASEHACFDPVEEMFWKIKRKDSVFPELRHLVNRPLGSTEIINLPLAAAKRCAVMNFYGKSDPKNEDSSFILVLSDGGMTEIKASLDKAGMRSQQPRDSKWVDFLLGDVTDPEIGLEARASTKVASGNQERGIPTNILVFSDSETQLVNARQLATPRAALAQRHNFFDIDAVWNIPTSQAIVDRLIDDGEIPLEFMKKICGNHCDFPSDSPVKFSAESTSFAPESKRSTPDPDIPVFSGSQSSEPRPAAAFAAPTPAAMPPASDNETPKAFSERIDKEVAARLITDPSATFITVLNNDTEAILRYIQGKNS